MSTRVAFTSEHVRAIPVNLRVLIGKYFADSRWQETSHFYDSMPERYRETICFHSELKKRHTLLKLHEMVEVERERVIGAIDELRQHFAKYRKHAISNTTFIQRLPVSVRKTLYRHAELSQAEFSQPIWRVEDKTCAWSNQLIKAIRELLDLFQDAPDILTAVKPEVYFN